MLKNVQQKKMNFLQFFLDVAKFKKKIHIHVNPKSKIRKKNTIEQNFKKITILRK